MIGSDASGDDDLLTLEAAAQRIGVHYMTAYRYVRLGRLQAVQRGGRWLVSARDVDRFQETPSETPGRRGPRWGSRRQRLVARLLEGDGQGGWAIVEQALASGATPLDLYLQLLAPALREIGDQWATGLTSIDEEHRATSVAVRIAGRLAPHFARPGRTRRGAVILGGAPGDPHQLPVAMVADVLRSEGLLVVDLGANVPTQSLLEAAAGTRSLKAVGISVSVDSAMKPAARSIAAVKRGHPGVSVFAGGPALPTASHAMDLGADDWAPDAAAAATLFGAAPRPASEAG
jgi:MerR family transcriptional regulator, light-induced transcriptional regulator